VNTEIKLPGYYVQYGGQFENLQSAKARLMVGSTSSIILDFKLYFAFGSIKEALMVYSAIPLCSGRWVFFYG
jgi:cobalt-zinc-cadmium resistance protein CzcA